MRPSGPISVAIGSASGREQRILLIQLLPVWPKNGSATFRGLAARPYNTASAQNLPPMSLTHFSICLERGGPGGRAQRRVIVARLFRLGASWNSISRIDAKFTSENRCFLRLEQFTQSIGMVLTGRIAAIILMFILDERCSQHMSKNSDQSPES